MTHPVQIILYETEKQMANNPEKPPEERRHRGGCVKCNFDETGTYYGYILKNALGQRQQYSGHPNDVFDNNDPLRKEALYQMFARDCECKRKQRTAQRLELMDVPPKHRHCCFQGFRKTTKEQRDAYSLARGYLMRKEYEQARGVIFHGGVGKGKTHLAVALYRELLDLEYRGKFMCANGTFHFLKNNIEAGSRNMDREGETQLDMMACGQEVIVFDDIAFQGRMSPWEIKETGDLIDYCYKNEIRFIGTTNLKWPEAVSNLLGKQIADRLTEMCIPIYCGGVSQRVEKAKELEAEVAPVKDDGLPF